MSISDLELPEREKWAEAADDRRTLLLYNGPVTDPVGALSERGWDEFELITSSRALADGPELGEAAARTHPVPDGRVDELAASLVGGVEDTRLVALGGGRVIDTAKAIASLTGAEVAAIPTTLSGAPITGFHRLPAGREAEVEGFNRPALVVGYADAMTSAPEPQLRATAMNRAVTTTVMPWIIA